MEKILIIDFDDTLIKTIDVHAEAWRQSLNKTLDIEIPKDRILNDINYGIDVLLKKFQLSDDEIKKSAELKKKFFNKTLHNTRVNELLLYICKNNFFKHIVIASNSSKENLMRLLSYHNINTDLFSMIITRDDVKKKKPYPEMGDLIFSKFSEYDKSDYLMIGDSDVDKIFATKLGIKCIITNC
jgi:phosphoglycolate phosphatase-like HAD superfamily hydrolase